MFFNLRTDSQNGRHVRFSVIADGVHCGYLSMTVDEWKKFAQTLLLGAQRNDSVDASVTHQNHPFDREEAFRALDRAP